MDAKGAVSVKLFADFLGEALLILKKEAAQAGKLDLEAARRRLNEMIKDKVPVRSQLVLFLPLIFNFLSIKVIISTVSIFRMKSAEENTKVT